MDQKQFLDEHVVPLLGTPAALRIYTAFWSPHSVLVYLIAGEPPGGEPPSPVPPTPEDGAPFGGFDQLAVHLAAGTGKATTGDWGAHIKRLLDAGWKFDALREPTFVRAENQMVPIFGGDGTPMIAKNSAISVRLFQKLPNGVNLILQIGAQCPDAMTAAATVKDFFAQFDKDPMAVVASHAVAFGAA